MKQIKIGVLGENPRNDADAFTVLLKKNIFIDKNIPSVF